MCPRHGTNLRPDALPLYATMSLQVFLQCSQAPFGTHPITVSILVGNEAWLVLVDAVVGHMHTPPPAPPSYCQIIIIIIGKNNNNMFLAHE